MFLLEATTEGAELVNVGNVGAFLLTREIMFEMMSKKEQLELFFKR